jgi:serine kinase of HPr protein (carbohydrate metabolism regulator)
MKLTQVAKLLEAEVLCGSENMDEEVYSGYGADLMSDVLAFASHSVLLLTGLTNIQIFRTAQMMDIPAIVFVRGKSPQEDLLKLASRASMPLLTTKMSMFEACGILYEGGLSASSHEKGD